ncbi:hypothetical protein [Jiella mangrovi]|uniref:Nutrient deprivation-induced protein n=1 Tax=Jiella mangrovi TaxID=2821407 RepID=A0ABS4BM59_9HYPH|nr:hypothetical protein [Jiella mangrovi]MBP0617814.1 hypothetical protein [Jiella mangrovi]
MISEPSSTSSGSEGTGQAQDDLEQAKARGTEEFESAKTEARKATDSFRDTASDLSERARETAYEQGEKGKETVVGGLEDFAAAVRKASDELGSRDQSMASQVVREVAGGLEQASRTIHGKDIGELTQSVARFARERPTTFLVGAALAGLALGRFARASSEHNERDYASDPGGTERSDMAHQSSSRGYTSPSRSAAMPSDYRSTYREQLRPAEGAYPAARDPVTGTSRHGSDDLGQTDGRPKDTLAAAKAATPPPTAKPISSTSNPLKGENNER